MPHGRLLPAAPRAPDGAAGRERPPLRPGSAAPERRGQAAGLLTAAQAQFRFHGALGDFLPAERRDTWFGCSFNSHQTVKHLIESLGVPHPEVGRVLVNGAETDWSYLVRDGDRIEVFPAPHGAPDAARFVLDTHLGRLAAYLRMLGFDTLYRPDHDDPELARIAGEEARLLLTRDRGLLMRSAVTFGYYVRETNPRRQLAEIVRRFDLRPLADPFTRCMRCNGRLRPAPKDQVAGRVPPRSRRQYEQYWECPDCRRVYWEGSHHRKMVRLMRELLGGPA